MAVAQATLVYTYPAAGVNAGFIALGVSFLAVQLTQLYGSGLAGSFTALETALNQLYGATVASDTTTFTTDPFSGFCTTATRTLVFNVGAQFNAQFPGGIADPAAIGAWTNMFSGLFSAAVGAAPYVASGPQVTLS